MGTWPTERGRLTGNRPLGFTFAGQHVGQTVTAFFSRWKHLQQRVRSPGNSRQRVDAPTEHDRHQRGPRLSNRLDQFLLHAREIEVRRIVALSDSDRSQESTTPCNHDHGHVSLACHLHGLCETRAVISQHLTAFGVAYLHVLPESGSQPCKWSDVRSKIRTGCIAPSRLWNHEFLGLNVLRSSVDEFQVSRIVVIALQEPFVVSTRSDDCHALDGRSQWQHPVIAQQDGRFGGSLTSERALLGRLERRVGGCRVNIGVLEEPELKFEAEHAPNCCIDDLKWHPSRLNFGFQRLPIAVNGWQFHIEPSRKGQPSSLPRVAATWWCSLSIKTEE